MTNPTPTVLILVGPTASGKTALAVELAKRFQGEVVSADSRQIYRYLDIGTAKPSLTEQDSVPHHGFDVVDPDAYYSAGRFAKDARRWIRDIHARGHHPIVAGGSGLYLQALVDGLFDGDDIKDDQLRDQLEARAESEGLDSLYEELKRLDPVYSRKIVPGDRQRILRALEVIHASGEPFSALHEREQDEAPFKATWFGLRWERETLYRRIDQRVDLMLDHGLVAEVKGLLDRGYRDANALKSVGYVEIIDHLEGRIATLEEGVERIKQNSRNYAKRQLTWFRRNERITWLDAEGKGVRELADEVSSRA
ncbi:tRNA (adenosine(37)-N6)-dimethylallyltransferase MiaA [bacterium]|nr:tRNA (adenosine(37)-N6)-dimethylallyltransferase MiaA [bacterium]